MVVKWPIGIEDMQFETRTGQENDCKSTKGPESSLTNRKPELQQARANRKEGKLTNRKPELQQARANRKEGKLTWLVSSRHWARPVAPRGWPLLIRPPLGFTTYLPPYVLSPKWKRCIL